MPPHGPATDSDEDSMSTSCSVVEQSSAYRTCERFASPQNRNLLEPMTLVWDSRMEVREVTGRERGRTDFINENRLAIGQFVRFWSRVADRRRASSTPPRFQ
jgi:hypothetical protein